MGGGKGGKIGTITIKVIRRKYLKNKNFNVNKDTYFEETIWSSVVKDLAFEDLADRQKHPCSTELN